ncbi:MAG: glycosyltransferase [Armatimonadetes bacterium]|nr:glycosyltransferase [Armatimonadota bacterium]
MSAPLVSIIMPCWNAARYLDEAMASIVAQTYSDFEVVVVDDGSEDETPSVLDAWTRRDLRVRVVRQEHQGLVVAPQRAVEESRGEFLARMDSDDLMHPPRLEWQVEMMRARPRLGMVGGLIEFFPRETMRAGMRRYERWLNSVTTHEEITRDMFVEHPLAHPSVMMRREAVEEVGGYREMKWPEDYDLCLRMYGAGWEFAKVPQVLHRWRDRPDRVTRADARYAKTKFRACKVHFLRELHLRGRDTVQVWGAGKEGRALGKHLKRAGLTIARYLDIAPTKIGGRVLGAPVTDAQDLAQDHYLLVAVGAKGARAQIRAELTRRGWREPEDYCTMS